MSQPAPDPAAPITDDVVDVAAQRGVAKWWWLFLLTGVLWLVIAGFILQFDTRSVATVGYIVGFMLIFSGIELCVLAAAVNGGWKVLWAIFGILLLVGGAWAVFNPLRTTAGLATSLGLLFAVIAALWIIEAFATKKVNPLWGLTLACGIVMAIIAVWVAGQLFGERVATLLLFAGVWAIMHGIGDFVRAFELRRLGKLVARA